MSLLPFRLHLLALIGLPLAACVPTASEPVCTPDLPRTDDPLQVPDADAFLSCFAEPEGGCPDYTAVGLDTLASTGDELCWYEGDVVCGPENTDDGTCCYEVAMEGEVCEGRPFAPTGEARHAAPGATDWADRLDIDGAPAGIAAAWRQAALEEHAAVASFARFGLQLLGLGAPPELVMEAARAQADEVRHARLAFGIAAALGDTGGIGALDVRGEVVTDPSVVLRETFLGGCVGETVAAAIAAAARDQAVDPAIRAALDVVARDETRHAALAWKVVRWLIAEHPALRSELQALLTVRPVGGPATAEVRGWGRLGAAEQARLVDAVMAQVVRPCAAAVLHVHEAAPVSAG